MSNSSFPDHPAALRNLKPIVDELTPYFANGGSLLEVASGGGTHAEHCARHFPSLQWQPTEAVPDALARLNERVAAVELPNLLPPKSLDVLNYRWQSQSADFVLAINLIHIAPLAVMEQLVIGAAECLRPNGKLILYGPYTINRQHTAKSNQFFDADLKARNPTWGIRDVDQVRNAAATVGLQLSAQVAMPANNQLLVLAMEG